MGFFETAGRAKLGEEVRRIQAAGRAGRESEQRLETGDIEQGRLRNLAAAETEAQTRRDRPILLGAVTDRLKQSEIYTQAGENVFLQSLKARGAINVENGVETVRAEDLDAAMSDLNDPNQARGFAAASLEEFKARSEGAGQALQQLEADLKSKGKDPKSDKTYQAALAERETANRGVLHYNNVLDEASKELRLIEAKGKEARATQAAKGETAAPPAKLAIARALMAGDETLSIDEALDKAKQLGTRSIPQFKQDLTLALSKPNPTTGRVQFTADEVEEMVNELAAPFEKAKDTTRSIVKTGIDKDTGRKVVQYSDGSVEYAD